MFDISSDPFDSELFSVLHFLHDPFLPRLETMYIAQLDTKIVVPVGHGAIFAMMQPVFVISREFVLECQVGHHPEP